MPGSPDQSPEVDAFFDAILAGDPGPVRLQTALDPSLVHARDHRRFGATPITVAAQTRNLAMIDTLLTAGADINAKSDWWAGGFGPLHLGPTTDPDGIAAALIERGAVVDAHAAARLGMIDRLRELVDEDRAVVRERGGDGQFPLHFARTPEIAAFLLDRGAAIDARDIDHVSTAAQWAIEGRDEVSRYLVSRGAETDEFMAAATGDTAGLKEMIEHDPETLQRQLTAARFNSPGSTGGHMHMYTIGDRATVVHAAARYGRSDTLRMVLDAGGDPNIRGWYDESTPLHCAAWHDQPDAIALLIERGAMVDQRSGAKENDTPVNWAIVKAAASAARALIERGAPVGDEQRALAERGLEGKFRSFTGIESGRYAEIAAMVAEA